MKHRHLKSTPMIACSALLVLCLVVLMSACSMTPKGAIETEKSAKNVILLIGDGYGFNQEASASCYVAGENGRLQQQALEVQLAMSTYMENGSYDPETVWSHFDQLKRGATDSAAAGTTMATGKKTVKGVIGLGPDKERLISIVEWAETLGKSTGIVTSVQLSHATPASFVAHNESRANYEAIAREMLGESAVDVLIGCGHPYYNNDGKKIDEGRYLFVGGKETWDALAAGTLGADADGDGIPDAWTLYEEIAPLMEMESGKLPKRIALVPRVHKTLNQERGGDNQAAAFEVPLNESVPRLHQLTAVALKALERDEDGFFLMVEGGAIDWAGHSNQTGRMIEETIDFSAAIQVVISWIENNGGFEENLLIVTSDHETGYLTGPVSGLGDPAELWTPVVSAGTGIAPAHKWNSNGHTNSLVPFYAEGPGAKLFLELIRGEDPKMGPYIDNTDIAPVILSTWGVVVER